MTETIQKLLDDGSIDRASKIICDYLDILKINADMIELERTNFNFAILVSQVEEALAPLAAEKNIEIKCLNTDSEFVVNADYNRMTQALSNLLYRAIISSSSPNSVTVKVTDSSSVLAVEIYDSGPPLQQNEIHRIVNSSDWIKEQFRAGREELALGLRIAKEFVEMHGGRIWAESSDEGRGNILCLTIPKSRLSRKVDTGVNTVEV